MKKILLFLGMLILLSNFVYSVALSDQMAGCWAMEETTGVNISDSTNNKNHGFTQAGTTIIDGIIGKGRFIDQTEFIQIPNSNSLEAGGSMSVCLWINWTASTANGGLMTMSDGTTASDFAWLFVHDVASDSAFLYKDALDSQHGWFGTGSGNPVSTGLDWVHICYTLNSTHIVRYWNGTKNTPTDDVTPVASFHDDNYDLFIGKWVTGQDIAGAVDEVMYWVNRTLTPTEVSTIYNNRVGTSCNEILFPNTAPNTPTPEINSTDGTNLTGSNLTCFDVVTDPEGNIMNATVEWFLNGSSQFIETLNDNFVNGSTVIAMLDKNNLSVGDFWNCSIQLTDGIDISNWGNSSSIEILQIPIMINELFLINKSSIAFNLSGIPEKNPFFVQINVTNNNEVDSGLECNFTSFNISSDHIDIQPNNLTLTSTNSYEFTLISEQDSIFEDIFQFNLCRNNNIRDVELYINDNISVLKVIDGDIIPLCGSGIHTEINFTKNFTNSLGINVSIRCPSCGGINTIDIVSFNFDIDKIRFKFDRQFILGKFNLTFNSSNNLYEHKELQHSFDVAGTFNINVTCNGTFQSFSIISGDEPPTAVFIEATTDDGVTVNFTSGIEFESPSEIKFLGDCGNEVIIFQQMNITNSSDFLIKSVLNETINVTNDNLSRVGTYNLILHCRDDEGTTVTITDTFIYNDTVLPSVTFFSPLEDNSTEIIINGTLDIEFLFSDTNLFGYNISCTHSIIGNVFSEVRLNISGSSFLVDNVTPSMAFLGSGVCTVEVCDDHTIYYWTVDSVKTDKTKKNITINNNFIVSDYSAYDVDSITFYQKRDRLSWCFDYLTFGDVFNEKRYTYRISKGNGFIERNKIIGHFASWNLKLWIDLMPDSNTDLRFDYMSSDFEFYYLHFLSMSNRVCMESIGGLNCRNFNVTWSVVSAPPPSEEVVTLENITTPIAVFFLVMVILYLGLLAIGVFSQSGSLIVFGCVIGIILGMTLFNFSHALSIILVLINLVIGFFGFKEM